VDFILNNEIAIEVKSTELVQDRHLKGLNKFSEGGKVKRKIVLSLDKNRRKIGDIEIIPYREFLNELWSGGVI
jgi:uncharacterized protein